MTKTSFEDMAIVKNPMFSLRDYNAFINLFQKQAQLHCDKIYFRYQMKLSDGSIVVKSLTFGEVDRITSNLACDFHKTLGSKSVIALLEDHSVYYLITQLALQKLRIPVLLLSPRNSAEYVVDLLKQVKADVLIYGQRYELMKNEVMVKARATYDTDILFTPIPSMDFEQLVHIPLHSRVTKILDHSFSTEDLSKTSVIIHSSGTTSAPKAIYWSNRFQLYFAQVTAFNHINTGFSQFTENEKDATIGIVPSWHMFGIYSNFTSLVNGSSQFYFAQFPPSIKEVINAIKYENITRVNAPPYYVNQMVHYMKETGDVECFQKLKLIVSAGAPIAKDVDDFIVEARVNLQMQYGMSECCNLMASDLSERRINSNIYYLNKDAHMFTYFEHFDGDRYQLIIRSGAPFLATNLSSRKDGDYATKDLFVKSPLSENGYTYVGRADDTLVMANGEKTNPLPMEDVIKSSPLVSRCTVIGEARPCTAALIELNFETVKSLCLDVVFEKLLEIVNKANEDAPSYSTILPQMVKVIPFDKNLPFTDKGTVARKRAIQEFQVEIDEMYENFLASNKSGGPIGNSSLKVRRNSIHSTVMDAMYYVLGRKTVIQEEDSLFKQGLNSLLAIQLRNRLTESFFDIPQDFLYDHSTVNEVVAFFEGKTNNDNKSSSGELHDDRNSSYDYQATTDILQNYLHRASTDIINPKTKARNSDEHDIVLLTGATGSLGSYILYKLLQNKKVKKVYALVRPRGDSSLLSRISDAFKKRGYPTSILYDSSRLEILPMNLEKDRLGFSTITFDTLRSEVTTILACAWLLDFKHTVSHYNSECLEGLYNLVKFANGPSGTKAIDLHFVSSVSASAAYSKEIVPEKFLPADPHVALPMGYAQSKYIVEQLFHYLVTEKNMPCFIHRVGQLCGDSRTGIWNSTEMYPLMILGGGTIMKKMPAMDTNIDWLPVDYAGQAIIDIMLTTKDTKQSVFHVVNSKSVSWSSMLEIMKVSGIPFKIVDPETWVKELSEHQENPAYKLLSFYKSLFIGDHSRRVQWATNETESVTSMIASAPTVNDRLGLYLKSWAKPDTFRLTKNH